MEKKDVYIKVNQVVDDSIGEEGQALRMYFNVPDEFEDENGDYICSDLFEVEGSTPYEPLATIDDAIRVLNKAKELGANFVSIWSHDDHQEIHIEAFAITQLTEEEVDSYKAKKQLEIILANQSIKEENERQEYERLKKKFG